MVLFNSALYFFSLHSFLSLIPIAKELRGIKCRLLLTRRAVDTHRAVPPSAMGGDMHLRGVKYAPIRMKEAYSYMFEFDTIAIINYK